MWIARLALPLAGLAVVAGLAAMAPPSWQEETAALFGAYILIVLGWALWRLSHLLWVNRVLVRPWLRGRHRRAWEAYVRALFDGYAATYDKHLVDKLNYDGPSLLDSLLDEQFARDGSRDIADLGCGTGLCGPVLKPFARHLTGIDLSASMIERARDRACYDSLEVANLLSFLLEHPRSFDGLCAIDVLPYFRDLDHLFGACRTALRHDGWLVATTESADRATSAPTRSRFMHGSDEVRASAGRVNLAIIVERTAILRREAGQPVTAGLFLLADPETDPAVARHLASPLDLCRSRRVGACSRTIRKE